MINNAARYVKIGGVILYSTCTLEVMENQGVIEEFLQTHENFVLDPIREIDEGLTSDGMLLVTPCAHGMDGFFACRLKRNR
jgi:16S rRNA (cytosine967-C5)-methyltransferase